MDAEKRIEAARKELSSAGLDTSFRRNGDHYVASSGQVTDSYLGSTDDVATFFEDEATRAVRSSGGKVEIANPAPTTAARKSATRTTRKQQTNRSNTMASAQKEIKKAVSTVPKAATIAGGTAVSQMVTNGIIGKVLAGQHVLVQKGARIAIPLALSMALKRIKVGDASFRGNLATGAEVDAAVAALRAVGDYIPGVSTFTDRLSVAPGATTLGAPVLRRAVPAVQFDETRQVSAPAAKAPTAPKPRTHRLTTQAA